MHGRTRKLPVAWDGNDQNHRLKRLSLPRSSIGQESEMAAPIGLSCARKLWSENRSLPTFIPPVNQKLNDTWRSTLRFEAAEEKNPPARAVDLPNSGESRTPIGLRQAHIVHHVPRHGRKVERVAPGSLPDRAAVAHRFCSGRRGQARLHRRRALHPEEVHRVRPDRRDHSGQRPFHCDARPNAK